jgi:hypothetical protein
MVNLEPVRGARLLGWSTRAARSQPCSYHRMKEAERAFEDRLGHGSSKPEGAK